MNDSDDLYAIVQDSAKGRSPSLMNLVTALAYHFCLALAAAFTQPGYHLLAEPCNAQVAVSFVSMSKREI